MTNTNNSAKYAVSLDYEVREADNSINCKNAYKVFDNMQDAANYAIDFIANNPDANIRLTNEHFNGSQISVYGDSPTKHYDLTDADINAVRNVEVNEADEAAVTEEAQDVATNSEIRNANIASGNYDEYVYCGNDHGIKLYEFVTYKNHSIVRIENPRYGLTLDITFRGNKVFKHNGRRIAAKAVAEVYMNRERADEQFKIFRAYFDNIPDNRGCFEVWAHLTYADGQEHKYMFEFNQTKQVEQFKQEVQSLAADNNTPCQIYVKIRPYKSNVTAWVDPHQYGEPGNLEQPRDISVYCNKPAAESTTPVTVNDEDTVFAAYEAAINGDRAYVLKAQELFTAHADADTLRSFQLAYAQDRKQYGENISQAIRALGDNRSEGYNEKLQSLIDTWDAESDKVLTVNKTIFNQRLIEALIQKFDESAMSEGYVTAEAMDIATEAEIENAQAVNEPATPTDRRAQIDAEMSSLAIEIGDARIELMDAEDEINAPDFDESTCTPQSHIDYLKDRINTLRARYEELWRELADLDRPPTNPTDRRAQINAEMSSLAIEIADAQSVNCNRFLIDIDVENTETGNCVTKSKFQSNACDAANWIINFAAKHHTRKIIGAKIRDFENIYTSYQFTDADINALYPNDNLPESPDNFEREYAQAAAATDRIRKIDPDAEIIFAADEPAAERFVLTTADNSCANCATAAEAEDLFYQLQADKPAPTVKTDARSELPYSIKFPNGEELRSLDGKWNHVASDKYGADIYRNGLTGEPEFVIRYSDDDKQFVTEEKFFAEMVKRGACTIDEPPTPPTVESDAYIFANNVAEFFVGHDFHFDFAEIVNGRLKHHFADYRYGDRFIETYTDATPSKLLYATEIIPLAYGSCNYVLNDFTTLTRNAFGSLASVEAAERDIESKNPVPTVEPTDDDNTFIATDGTRYVVKGDRVDITADGCQLKINGVTVAQYKTAHAAQVAANEIRNFRKTYGGAACLPHKDFDPADFDTMFNDNDLDFSGEGKTIIIDEPPADPLTAAQAEYDAARAASQAATQAVIDADNALRHAKELEHQAAERESAAFFKLGNLKREIIDTVDRLNDAAPEGWSVVPDPDNKKFFVKAGGKSVAEIDSLALAKVLPPDKFFARFTPLTDDEPNQRYADQLYQEYLELLDMRDNLSDDPERLKVIDGLIRNLEREMLAARLDLPTSTPTTAC